MSGPIKISLIQPVEIVIEGQEAGLRRLTPMDGLSGDRLDQVANLVETMQEAARGGRFEGVMTTQKDILMACSDLTGPEIDAMQAGQRKRLIDLICKDPEPPETEKKMKR